MEKSQWDLKSIRFQRRKVTRLDDFVQRYQEMHDALLREYSDTERVSKKVIQKKKCVCVCVRMLVSLLLCSIESRKGCRDRIAFNSLYLVKVLVYCLSSMKQRERNVYNTRGASLSFASAYAAQEILGSDSGV